MAVVGIAGAAETNAVSEPPGIGARQNFEVNAGLAPPEIMGRRFWNMLSVVGGCRNKSDPKPLPTEKHGGRAG